MESSICDVPGCPLYNTDGQTSRLIEVKMTNSQIGFIPEKCWRCSEVCIACRYHPVLPKEHYLLSEESSQSFKNESRCALFCFDNRWLLYHNYIAKVNGGI